MSSTPQYRRSTSRRRVGPAVLQPGPRRSTSETARASCLIAFGLRLYWNERPASGPPSPSLRELAVHALVVIRSTRNPSPEVERRPTAGRAGARSESNCPRPSYVQDGVVRSLRPAREAALSRRSDKSAFRRAHFAPTPPRGGGGDCPSTPGSRAALLVPRSAPLHALVPNHGPSTPGPIDHRCCPRPPLLALPFRPAPLLLIPDG